MSERQIAHTPGHGDRTPVLLLDGFDDDAWTALVPLLARDRRVVTCTADAATLEERAEEAVALLDRLGIGRAHVLGGSLGAATALRLAADRPERVRTLVVSGAWARSDRALRAVLASWLWTIERASAIDDVLHVVYGWTHGPASWNAGETDDAIVRAARGRERDWPAWRRDAEALVRSALHHDVAERLRDVTAPALVIVGDDDPLTPPRFARELAALLPHASLATIPDAGHRAAHDQPDAFAELLLPFLAAAEQEPAGVTAAAR